jgi:hypothetical protein
MCLSHVEEIPKQIKKRKIGWKMFYGFNSEDLRPYLYPPNGNKLSIFGYKIGKWYTSTKEILGFYPTYESGFHIYQTKKEAISRHNSWNVHKVEYDDVVAYGKQDGQRVIVARKMRILS